MPPSASSTTSEKQVTRSFMLGSEAARGMDIVKIIEKIDESQAAGSQIYFDIYVASKKEPHNEYLWKSYTPQISDIEREYDI